MKIDEPVTSWEIELISLLHTKTRMEQDQILADFDYKIKEQKNEIQNVV